MPTPSPRKPARFRIEHAALAGHPPWLATDTERGASARTYGWPRALRWVLDTLAHEAGPPRGDGVPWIEL